MMCLTDRKWGLGSWTGSFRRICCELVQAREHIEFVLLMLRKSSEMHLGDLFRLLVELFRQLCALCLLAFLLWCYSIWVESSATPYCCSTRLKAPDGAADFLNYCRKRSTHAGSVEALAHSNECDGREYGYSFEAYVASSVTMASAEHGPPSSAPTALASPCWLSDLLFMHLDSLDHLLSKFGDLPTSRHHMSNHDLRWHHQALAIWCYQSLTEWNALAMDRLKRLWPGCQSSGCCCCDSEARHWDERWSWHNVGWHTLRVPWWLRDQAAPKRRDPVMLSSFCSLVCCRLLAISRSQYLKVLELAAIFHEVCDSVSGGEVFSRALAAVSGHVSWCDVIYKYSSVAHSAIELYQVLYQNSNALFDSSTL